MCMCCLVGENGMGVIREADLRREERVVDADRVDWYRSSFKNIKWVLDAGMPLIGVSFWSCIDNLEVSTETRFVAFGPTCRIPETCLYSGETVMAPSLG